MSRGLLATHALARGRADYLCDDPEREYDPEADGAGDFYAFDDDLDPADWWKRGEIADEAFDVADPSEYDSADWWKEGHGPPEWEA